MRRAGECIPELLQRRSARLQSKLRRVKAELRLALAEERDRARLESMCARSALEAADSEATMAERRKIILHAWPRLLDARLAAAYLGVGASTIRDYANAGLLKPVRLPGSRIRDGKTTVARPQDRRLVKLLFDRQDLDAFVNQQNMDDQRIAAETQGDN